MGVSPVTSYGPYTGNVDYNSLFERIGFRWIVDSVCEDINNREWYAWCKLQIKVASGTSVKGTTVKYYDHNTTLPLSFGADYIRNSDGTKATSKGFPASNEWTDVYIESGAGTSYFGVENGLLYLRFVQEYDDYSRKRAVKEVDFFGTVVEISDVVFVNTASPDIPSFYYGGINYSDVSNVDCEISNVTSASADFQCTFKAPYDCQIEFRLRDSSGSTLNRITENVEAGNKSMLFSTHLDNLSPYTNYAWSIIIKCENNKQADDYNTFRTDPIFIESITCPDDIYVNEGETITLEPVISPSNATLLADFNKDDSGAYGRTNTYGRFTIISGITASLETHYIDIVARDTHKVSKRVNVHVCRPVDRITTIEKRRVAPEETYKLSCIISPSGTTDNTVVFTTSDANIATVDSTSGIITGITNGETTITVSCAKRIINEYGVVTGYSYVTSTTEIVVSSDPEWQELYALIPYSTLEAWYIDAMHDNFSVLRDCLQGYEYEKDGQIEPVNIPAFISPQTNGQETPIYDVAKCLNAIEDDIDKIYNATKNIEGMDYASNVYGQKYTWGGIVEDYHPAYRWQEYMEQVYIFCLNEGIFSNEVTS